MKAAEIIALASASLTVLNKSIETLEAMKQNKEMTPEEEANFDGLVAERMASPHWKKSTDE